MAVPLTLHKMKTTIGQSEPYIFVCAKEGFAPVHVAVSPSPAATKLQAAKQG